MFKIQRLAALIALIFLATVGMPLGRATAANPAGPFLISGTLTAIAPDSISVQQRNQTTIIPINTATIFQFDGKPTTLAGLKTGLAVGVWGTTGKPAVEIHVFTPKPPATRPAPAPGPGPFLISGTLTAIAADSISVRQRNQTTVIPINAATVFKFDGKPSTAADLKPGLAVGVWGTAGKPAVEVHTFTPKTP